MSTNGKKALALVLAAGMLFGFSACGKNQNRGSEGETVYIGAKFKDDKCYIVEKGDTLRKISRKFYDDSQYYKELAIYNSIEDPNFIRIGQKIYVPKTLRELFQACYGYEEGEVKIYTVQKGDTLSEICENYYDGDGSRDTVNKLATFNNLEDPNFIKIGQELKIPSKDKLDKVKSRDYSDCYKQVSMLRELKITNL